MRGEVKSARVRALLLYLGYRRQLDGLLAALRRGADEPYHWAPFIFVGV